MRKMDLTMYTKLLNYLKTRPTLYEKSSTKFWDDEHISMQMLQAHLNPDIDSATRKHEYVKESAKWIAEIIGNPINKNLLDLGCGPGLYATEFDNLGFKVTGIDFSKRSIDYATKIATKENRKIEYNYKNYLDIRYENQFDVITLIFCDYGVLAPNDRKQLLSKAITALKADGILILDVFSANNYKDFSNSRSVLYEDKGFWSDEPYMCLQNNYCYEQSNTYLEQFLVATSKELNCYNIWNQAFDMASLASELKTAGFAELQFYGDVCGKCLSDDDKTICVVARKI